MINPNLAMNQDLSDKVGNPLIDGILERISRNAIASQQTNLSREAASRGEYQPSYFSNYFSGLGSGPANLSRTDSGVQVPVIQNLAGLFSAEQTAPVRQPGLVDYRDPTTPPKGKGGGGKVEPFETADDIFKSSMQPVQTALDEAVGTLKPLAPTDHQKSNETVQKYQALLEELRKTPELKRARVSPEQLAIIGIASLFGGNTIAPQLLDGFYQGEVARTNFDNQKAQFDYKMKEQEVAILDKLADAQRDVEDSLSNDRIDKERYAYEVGKDEENRRKNAQQTAFLKNLNDKISKNVTVLSKFSDEFNNADPKDRVKVARRLREEGVPEFAGLDDATLVAWAKQVNPKRVVDNTRDQEARQQRTKALRLNLPQGSVLIQKDFEDSYDAAGFTSSEVDRQLFATKDIEIKDVLSRLSRAPKEFWKKDYKLFDSMLNDLKTLLNRHRASFGADKGSEAFKALGQQYSRLDQYRKEILAILAKKQVTPDMITELMTGKRPEKKGKAPEKKDKAETRDEQVFPLSPFQPQFNLPKGPIGHPMKRAPRY